MAKKREKIIEMIERIQVIINDAVEEEKQQEKHLSKVHPKFEESARNLIHYRCLRSRDLRVLQKKLGNMGLSRLAKAESHVLASLVANRSFLEGYLAAKITKDKRANFTIKQGNKLLNRNAKALLGYRSKGRRPRIMVTLPSEAGENYGLVRRLVKAGMNTARINCAHDGPEVWENMVQNVRKASKKVGRTCNVAMDLGGPKIRTGPLAPGPRLLKVSPDRDIFGNVVLPGMVWISPSPHPSEPVPHLPLSSETPHEFSLNQILYFTDTRGKARKLTISQIEEAGCWAKCRDTFYLQTGSELFLNSEHEGETLLVGDLPPIEQVIRLQAGDHLHIYKAPILGHGTRFDASGKKVAEASISTSAPVIFEYVKEGEPILFDDGKIRGRILQLLEDKMVVEILYAKQGGGKLKSDKGINLPTSKLEIRGLTEKDKRDLTFVVKHADVVNMSFVNEPQDVDDLIEALKSLDALDKIGVILKIETQAGFNNLVDILLRAMKIYPLGVMVARGDLAVEVGWENMARIQEEIMSICRAAHVPDIWATQVLENLAKKGIPSRSEITDAAMAQRAECVMLNKGPQILEAVRLLDQIMKDRQGYMEKNAPLLPALEKAERE